MSHLSKGHLDLDRTSQKCASEKNASADQQTEREEADARRESRERTFEHEPKRSGCPSPIRLVHRLVSTSTGEILREYPVLKDCGRKGCTYCRRKLHQCQIAHYADRFTELHREGWTSHLITLTIDPKLQVPDQETGELRGIRPGLESRKWNRYVWSGAQGGGGFISKIRYRTEDVAYFAAPEQGKRGHFHTHVIIAAKWKEGRDPETELRKCWKQSGGGAVVDVQRITPNGTGETYKRVKDSHSTDCTSSLDPLSAEERPDSIRTACAYVVAYLMKDQQGASEKESRRAWVSQGLGYYSKAAKERRRQYAKRKACALWGARNGGGSHGSGDAGRSDESLREEWWVEEAHGAARRRRGPRRPSIDALTALDKKRFERADYSACSNRYLERLPRGVWRVHFYIREQWHCYRFKTRPTEAYVCFLEVVLRALLGPTWGEGLPPSPPRPLRRYHRGL